MVSLDIIEREISELEARETSYAVCERLCWLYTVRDHMVAKMQEEAVGALGGSEFLKAVSGVPLQSLLKVMDEHMEALKTVYPREYEAVMRRIGNL